VFAGRGWLWRVVWRATGSSGGAQDAPGFQLGVGAFAGHGRAVGMFLGFRFGLPQYGVRNYAWETCQGSVGARCFRPNDTAGRADLARFKVVGASLIRSLIQLRSKTSRTHHLKRAAQAADPDDLR